MPELDERLKKLFSDEESMKRALELASTLMGNRAQTPSSDKPEAHSVPASAAATQVAPQQSQQQSQAPAQAQDAQPPGGLAGLLAGLLPPSQQPSGPPPWQQAQPQQTQQAQQQQAPAQGDIGRILSGMFSNSTEAQQAAHGGAQSGTQTGEARAPAQGGSRASETRGPSIEPGGMDKIAEILPLIMQMTSGEGAKNIDPDRLNLVEAIKPYVSETRVASVDRAIRMANAAKTAKTLLGILGR